MPNLSNAHQEATFDSVMAELQAPFTPEACERQTEREQQAAQSGTCCGKVPIFKMSIGAAKCNSCGALYRRNGDRIGV